MSSLKAVSFKRGSITTDSAAVCVLCRMGGRVLASLGSKKMCRTSRFVGEREKENITTIQEIHKQRKPDITCVFAPKKGSSELHFTSHTCRHTPINNWLFSCRWMCPSAGASCVAAGSSSRRSDASLTLRSARMRCHLLSFSGTSAFTRTSNGPLPTSKEKRTSAEAVEIKIDIINQQTVTPHILLFSCSTCRQTRSVRSTRLNQSLTMLHI